MRVYLPEAVPDSPGGINRVLHTLRKYLPEYGIEFTDSQKGADVAHMHVSLYEDFPPQLPLVMSSHGLMWEEDGWGKLGWKINRACVESYIKADVVTAPSEFVARAIERNTLIRPHIVRHGIDPDEYPAGTPQEYVLWNKGRVDAACSTTALQKLAELAPDVQFVTTFGTPAPNVEVIGGVPHSEMKQLIQNASVYLITPRESGGPSFGVLEAMSSAVPVLSWNYGGTAEAVDHLHNGYLAREGDYEDLLRGLYFSLKHQAKLGQNARLKVIREYDIRHTIKGYVEAYQQAVAPHEGPAVSVIVPCYNLGRHLEKCVQSVLGQDYKDVEVIIVNDASDDNTKEVADRLAQENVNVRVIHHETNQHVAATRNDGIKNSHGKYIFPLDADDRLATKESLGRMVQELEKSRDVQIVTGQLVIFHEKSPDQFQRGGWPNNTDFELQRTGFNRLPYASMYRRKVWENVGGYRTRIRCGVEDADFWSRALAFGYAAKILPQDVLHYMQRDKSLGKQNARGTEAWLPWFPWSYDPSLVPLGATGKGPYTTLSYDSPAVSVVVPVGPGHVKYIQTITDALLAQSEPNWELVLVNDSGAPLPDYPQFARVVNLKGNSGVAAARNAGVKAARSSKIVFVDADDIPQPLMLEVLLKAHEIAGGWIYGDWYYTTGEGIVSEVSKDWSVRELLDQSLGPITGLYEKVHIEEISGFDEEAPGWEDWDFHLRLLDHGICGTRVEYPLIMYNMHFGARREHNFAHHKEMLQYIKNKHKTLYRRSNVGCSKCGGKKSLKVTDHRTTSTKEQDVAQTYITLVYTGPKTGTRHFTGAPSRTKYAVGINKPFQAFQGDVEYFLRLPGFKRLAQAPAPQKVEVRPKAVLVNEMPAPVPTLLVEDLDIRPETLAMIRDFFVTVPELAKASDADLLKIKGVGPARLDEIRKAVAADGTVA